MTTRLARVVAAALAAFLIAGSAAAAYAHAHHYPNTVKGVEADCDRNFPLKGHYSLSVLHAALREVKSENLQYTNCADAIVAAIRADLGTPRSHPSVKPRHTPVTRPNGPVVKPSQKQIATQIQKLQKTKGAPFTLPNGQTVTPGAVTARGASFLSTLPTPLLIVLATLLAAVLAVSARAVQNLVRARRSG